MSDANNPCVIDTNVTIVANGNSQHASIDCELACIEFLENYQSLHIALDHGGLIMDEYSHHLSYAGQPNIGDAFFKYLHDNQYNPDGNIYLHRITANNNENQGFDELPVDVNFDPSDRKFLAVAVVANADVINATDADWDENSELLEQLNVDVVQLCPEHRSRGNA